MLRTRKLETLVRRARWAWWLALATLGVACGGDDAPETDTEGLRMCCELGAACHPGPEDPVNGVKQMCHALGHQNEPAACRAEYESCMAECVGEGEVEHGCL